MTVDFLKEIINEYGANNVQVPIKVPEKLNALIENKSNGKKAEYIRRLIYTDNLPELIQARIHDSPSGWIIKEDQKGTLLFNFKDRVKELTSIIKLAEQEIERTKEFQNKIDKAYSEYAYARESKLMEEVEE